MAGTTKHERKRAVLVLEDGSRYEGASFGYEGSVAGEVVFNTGMVGYPETLTDPSYSGQILVLTYPMVGNYGVPGKHEGSKLGLPFESGRVQIQGLIVSDYSERFSHWDAEQSLSDWLRASKVPALTGIDTRQLTMKLRESGTMLGKILFEGQPAENYDPNEVNLMPSVSVGGVEEHGSGSKRIMLIDCGAKNNIIECLTKRGVRVTRVPWDYDLSSEQFDGVMLTNGPGNPKQCTATIHQIRRLLNRDVPVFGICLGHQLLSLAIGADTYKLKYGHRSQNQPVIEADTRKCFITSQNHGYAVNPDSLPEGWKVWFTNLNDNTNEGIRHETRPIRSCQFHPEAAPGPVDTDYLFDEFVGMVNR